MSENYLETKVLKPAVEKLGGMCRKLQTPGYTGIPDRMVLMPGGYIYFVELKGVEKQPRPRQLIVHAALRKLGFKVFVIYTKEDVNKFIEEISII
jgi:hypothetical protein